MPENAEKGAAEKVPTEERVNQKELLEKRGKQAELKKRAQKYREQEERSREEELGGLERIEKELETAYQPEIDPKLKAEHNRISDEMKLHGQKNAWAGVERDYQELLKLEEQGVNLSYNDHILGAQGSRAAGDVQTTMERLKKAENINPTPEVTEWLRYLEKNYVSVEIHLKKKRPDQTLATPEGFLDPEQRAALEYANNQLATTGQFSGLLPAGEYTFGEQKITLSLGTTARVDLNGKV